MSGLALRGNQGGTVEYAHIRIPPLIFFRGGNFFVLGHPDKTIFYGTAALLPRLILLKTSKYTKYSHGFQKSIRGKTPGSPSKNPFAVLTFFDSLP